MYCLSVSYYVATLVGGAGGIAYVRIVISNPLGPFRIEMLPNEMHFTCTIQNEATDSGTSRSTRIQSRRIGLYGVCPVYTKSSVR